MDLVVLEVGSGQGRSEGGRPRGADPLAGQGEAALLAVQGKPGRQRHKHDGLNQQSMINMGLWGLVVLAAHAFCCFILYKTIIMISCIIIQLSGCP